MGCWTQTDSSAETKCRGRVCKSVVDKAASCILAKTAPAGSLPSSVCIEIKAEAASHWPGAVVKVKNTFIDLSPKHDDTGELSLLRAARRRQVQSCPHMLLEALQSEEDSEESPDVDEVSEVQVCGECPSHQSVSSLEVALLYNLLKDEEKKLKQDVPGQALTPNPYRLNAATLLLKLKAWKQVTPDLPVPGQHIMEPVVAVARDPRDCYRWSDIGDCSDFDESCSMACNHDGGDGNWDEDRGLDHASRANSEGISTTLPILSRASSWPQCCRHAATPAANASPATPAVKAAPAANAALAATGGKSAAPAAAARAEAADAAGDAAKARASQVAERSRRASEWCNAGEAHEKAAWGEEATCPGSKVHAEKAVCLSRSTQHHEKGLRRPRLCCNLRLDPRLLAEPNFCLVKKLLGRQGHHIKSISEVTQTKLRIRGRGSGFKEQRGREAEVPLMISLSAEHFQCDGFKDAFNLVVDLLQGIVRRFLKEYPSRQRSPPQHFWISSIEEASKECLGAMLEGLLHPDTIIAKQSDCGLSGES